MQISFACDGCGKRYKVDETKAGQTAKCRDCGTMMRVPVPAPPVERSESGSPVYRHQPRERDFEPAIGDSESIEAISEHIEKHLGPVDGVFHEIVSDLVHIDVHVVGPSDDLPFCKLITSGMSDRRMTVPDEVDEYAFAELMMCLPAEWKLKQKDFEDESNYWPIRLLKTLARLPHEYNTWLGPGHTVPNGGDSLEPYAENNRFVCALIMPPIVRIPSEFGELECDDGRTIRFYAVWPLYTEEMDFKLKKGLDDLLARLEKHRVTELVELDRPNCCARKPWWKIW